MRRVFATALLSVIPLLSQAADTIRVYNWNDYIAPEVLTDFTRATGIKVEYNTYESGEAMYDLLNSGEAIDVIVPTQDDLPTLIKERKLQALDFAQLPNRHNLDREMLIKLAAADPQNLHAIPYLWGVVGLAINTPQAEAAYGGPLPESWSLLFDAESSTRLASCGISMLNAKDDMLYNLLNFRGYNLADSPTTRILSAGRLLNELRPNLRYIDSARYIDDLNNGRLCLSVAWIGDALVAQKSGQPVEFVIPEEGSTLFIDNLAIPSTAKRPDLAHKFIDYIMQPEVAAKISNEVLYPNANVGASEFLDPQVREVLVKDLNEAKGRLFAMRPLSQKIMDARDQIWSAFIQ